MRVTSQTTVAAPIDTVWDALSNDAGISRWAPGLAVTMDRLGTAGPQRSRGHPADSLAGLGTGHRRVSRHVRAPTSARV